MHQRFASEFPPNDDGARGWTKKTIEQLAHTYPNGGWCWKSTDSTSPPSKDAIARQIEGRFEGWDVLTGAGANGPKHLASYPPAYHDLEGHHPIPVEGKDHLDGSDDDLTALQKQIAELTVRLDRLEGKLTEHDKALEQCVKHQTTITMTGRTATSHRHSHAVTVEGVL